MDIQLIAYSFVVPDGPLPECKLGTVDPDVHDYLSRHVKRIWDKAEKKVIDPTRFDSVNGTKPGERRVEALQAGSDSEFIIAADELVRQLYETTDNRMNRGFFVALRAVHEKKTLASVLKLDVYDVPAARLVEQGSGGALFEPVPDLLNLPGDLHKGAVFPDPRKDSDLAVVDVFKTRYFLRSLDARLFLGGKAAVDSFAYLVRKAAGPDKAKLVLAEAAARKQPATASALIKASKVLPEPTKKNILKKLEQPRSIGKVDARNNPRITTIYADGIEIGGTEQEIAKKVKRKKKGSKWLIEITADKEPMEKTR